MPRGLGDDPLSRRRKRSGSASSTNVTSDSAARQTAAGSVPAVAVAVAVASQMSHNDVFFRRRTDGSQAATENVPEQREASDIGEATSAAETSEIAEAIDIVRIAEVAQNTQIVRVPGAERAAETAAAVQPPSPVTDAPAAVVPAASQAEVPSQAQPEHRKSGGFFKRLFGRFGK